MSMVVPVADTGAPWPDTLKPSLGARWRPSMVANGPATAPPHRPSASWLFRLGMF